MTEKRFTLNYINEQHLSANIYDNGTFIASIGIGEELIVGLLNSLNDENKELKAKVDDKEVAVEVETCKIMEKVFALINEKIAFVNACEENSRTPKEDYYRGALEILELLKKELQE